MRWNGMTDIEFAQERTERMLAFEDSRRELDEAIDSLGPIEWSPPRSVSGEHDFEEWAWAVADGIKQLW